MGVNNTNQDESSKAQPRENVKKVKKQNKLQKSSQSSTDARTKVINNARSQIPGLLCLQMRNSLSDERIIEIVKCIEEKFNNRVPLDEEIYGDLLNRLCDPNASVDRRLAILNFFVVASSESSIACEHLYKKNAIQTLIPWLCGYQRISRLSTIVIGNLAIESTLYRDCALHHGAMNQLVASLYSLGNVCSLNEYDSESENESVDDDDDDDITNQHNCFITLLSGIDASIWGMSALVTCIEKDAHKKRSPNYELVKEFVNVISDVLLYTKWSHESIINSVLLGVKDLALCGYSKKILAQFKPNTIGRLCALLRCHSSQSVREQSMNVLSCIFKSVALIDMPDEFAQWEKDILPSVIHFTNNKKSAQNAWRLIEQFTFSKMSDSDKKLLCDSLKQAYLNTIKTEQKPIDRSDFNAEKIVKIFRNETIRNILLDDETMTATLNSSIVPYFLEQLLDIDTQQNYNIDTGYNNELIYCSYKNHLWVIPRNENALCSVIHQHS